MSEIITPSDRPIIRVTMLGSFQLSVGEHSVGDTVGHSHQLWNLLEYLIVYRNKTISQNELIEALWPDNQSDNPANALKNLVYRIRSAFAAADIPFAKELIAFNRGTYCWNNTLPCVVDVEEFEKLCKEAASMDGPEAQLSAYRKALELYQGDFLPGSSYEQWVVPLTGYYRSLYFKCVYDALDLLLRLGYYDEVRMICERATAIDPFEERAHRYLIHALVKQNKPSAALEHYGYVTDLFYRELGVKPSESLRGIYREITKSVNSVETDLSVIKEDLSEHDEARSAFCCDYEVFKNLYRLEARAASRSGQSIFLGLITVTDFQNNVPDLKSLNHAMDQLLGVIRTSLRRGDVVSRFSATQYVLMLPSLTYENGRMVLERVQKRFKASCRPKNIKLHLALQPLDPLD